MPPSERCLVGHCLSGRVIFPPIETQEQKRKSLYCHASQHPDNIYGAHGHASMEEFRGREINVKAAEAFVRLNGRTLGGSID